ncbi:MAG: alpha/beta hydrolase [Myxococcales bacterium]|nr:alpha/beta hydrolase [Myxococcales bacterium]
MTTAARKYPLETKRHAFTADDGATITYHRWLPEGTAPRALVLIAHGMGEHSGRYRDFADWLVDRGFGVYAHDQRGHGITAGGPNNLGYLGEPDGWNQCVRDFETFRRLAAAEWPGAPIVVFGHSMGSFLVQQFLYEHGEGLAAAALSAPTGATGFLRKIGVVLAKIESKRIHPKGRSKLLLRMSFGDFNRPFEPARTPFDWLSRDVAQVDDYIGDYHCGFILRPISWVRFLTAIGAMEKAENRRRIPKDLPVYLVGGGEDPVTNRAKGLHALAAGYKAAGMTRVTEKVYEGARHVVLAELNRDEVLADFQTWLEGALGGRSA